MGFFAGHPDSNISIDNNNNNNNNNINNNNNNNNINNINKMNNNNNKMNNKVKSSNSLDCRNNKTHKTTGLSATKLMMLHLKDFVAKRKGGSNIWNSFATIGSQTNTFSTYHTCFCK